MKSHRCWSCLFCGLVPLFWKESCCKRLFVSDVWNYTHKMCHQAGWYHPRFRCNWCILVSCWTATKSTPFFHQSGSISSSDRKSMGLNSASIGEGLQIYRTPDCKTSCFELDGPAVHLKHFRSFVLCKKILNYHPGIWNMSFLETHKNRTPLKKAAYCENTTFFKEILGLVDKMILFWVGRAVILKDKKREFHNRIFPGTKMNCKVWLDSNCCSLCVCIILKDQSHWISHPRFVLNTFTCVDVHVAPAKYIPIQCLEVIVLQVDPLQWC